MSFEHLSVELAAKKPFYKSGKFWWPISILLAILIFLGVSAAILVPRAFAAKDALEASVPLATQAKDQILAGNSDAAKNTVAELTILSMSAADATDFWLWRALEWVPFIGENMKAVRVVSDSVAKISTVILKPATDINLGSLKLEDGGFDVQKISDLLPLVEQADNAALEISENLSDLNTNELLDVVKNGVFELEGQVNQLADMTQPAMKALTVLPGMLGADGPRNYLLFFPNNAEIRAGGGNPAAISVLTADNGKLSITQQASSADFEKQYFDLNPETLALYGARTGNFMQDTTYTPYFDETAKLMLQFWAASFGTPIDGLVSFDPVALSYLIGATGPLTLDTGDVLTPENTVALLLNEVYFRYEDPAEQDAFFASTAESVFSAVSAANTPVRPLIDAFVKAAREGRLMFYAENEAQTELIGESRVTGPLPMNNEINTVVGVFYNYILWAKMDYYVDSSVVANTDMCTVKPGTQASFNISTTIKNLLTPEKLLKLPEYVLAGNPKNGDIPRDVMIYGPVGSTVASVEVDGVLEQPYPNVAEYYRWGDDYRIMVHNGRPVVQVPLMVAMQTEATVRVTFKASAGQPLSSFGPFEVRATPTTRTTPVEVTANKCG